ncbi:alkaline phosphatase D family protein [Sphingomonas guangdongensis]|nr:alkaline phosphatase D family protein [Sphingomonas guangdongensis]
MPMRAPAIVAPDRLRPRLPLGVMSGDPLGDRAMLWSAADQRARMVVEWSTDPSFRNRERRTGSLATPATGLTARLDLTGLPAGREVFYRVAFADPDDSRRVSDWTPGRLRMTHQSERSVRFTFAGDEAGQGFGINPDLGGYRLYEAMRQKQPDFFIHQGDQIYADGPLKPEVALAGGGVWRNLVTPAKDHVAETLEDFRGAYAYNLQDAHKRRFLAEVPMLVQWDDHEVRNNWWPDKPLAGATPMATLAANARRALLEYNPLRPMPGAAGIYRNFRPSPLIEVFMLDARSRRGANLLAGGPARRDGDMFGREQISWLEGALMRSTATWKVIASDIPLSLTVPDLNRDVAKGGIEGLADGAAGPPGGREPELARLLSFMRRHRIRNTVWLSADVHYAAAIRYEPGRAAFADFDPFWEFVAGPINAGTGTSAGNPLDPTFGPALVYDSMPSAPIDSSPRGGNQFFGMGEVDPVTGVLTMSIHDLNGSERFRMPIEPQR